MAIRAPDGANYSNVTKCKWVLACVVLEKEEEKVHATSSVLSLLCFSTYIHSFTDFAWNKVPNESSLILCCFGEKKMKKRKFTQPLRCGVQITFPTRTKALISFPLNSSMLLMIFCAILFLFGAFGNIHCWWNMLGSTFWGDKGRVVPIRTKAKVNWWQQRLTGVKLCHGSW